MVETFANSVGHSKANRRLKPRKHRLLQTRGFLSVRLGQGARHTCEPLS